jgi:hypothetical protein
MATRPQDNIPPMRKFTRPGVQLPDTRGVPEIADFAGVAAWKMEKEAAEALRRAQAGVAKAQDKLGRPRVKSRNYWNKQLQKAENVQQAAKTRVRLVKWGGSALDAAGAVATGMQQYQASTATSEIGRVVDGTLGAGADLLIGRNPIIGAIDSATGLILPENCSVGDHARTGIRALVTVGDYAATGDPRGLGDYQSRAMDNEYGPLFREVARSGEYWAQYGVGGGLKNAFGID